MIDAAVAASILDSLTDPWHHEFMRRAFVVSAVAAVACGVVGTFVVLRGMAFIGDAVAHAVFPGIAVAYVLGANLALGGAIAGVSTALGVAVVSRNRRLGEDTVIGVLFAFAFAVGVVLISTQSSYTGDLTSFLFGQILGISEADVTTVLAVGLMVVAVILILRRPLTVITMDREWASASGVRVERLEAALYALVAIAVVISLQAVGNILVLALLITPAATARLLTDRLVSMMALSGLIGSLGSTIGLYLAFHLDLAAGGLIVIVLTTAFALALVAAPRHGMLASRARRRDTGERADDPQSDEPAI